MSASHRRLLASGRSAAGALAVAVGVGVATALLAIAGAWLLARAITAAVQEGAGPGALVSVLAALAAVLTARAVLGWAAEIAAQRIATRVKADLRVRLLERAVTLGPQWAASRASSEVALLATRGLDALDAYYGRYLPQLALAAIVPGAVIACLFAVDVVAALTVALTVPLIPVFMILVGRMSEAHRERRWVALTRLARRFGDVVAGLPTLRAYGAAAAQVGILRRITDAYRTTTMSTLRIAFLSALVLELLATLSVALVAVGIGLRLAAGDLDLQTGLFVLVLAPEAYLPLRRLGAEFHASEEGITAAAAAFEIIDAPDPRAGGGPGVAPPSAAALVIEDVAVEQPGRAVIAPAGLSLEVRPGEIVAVTGPSGAGKSTLLHIVLGLVAPTAGRVVVTGGDGAPVDVRDLDAGAWSARVAWVPQVPFLFAGTVADNVRLGAPDATDAAVDRALAAVGLGDVPRERRLGERGAGLSSGQRRRVGIARALVREAAILLLDEPTAGLDDAAEATIMASVRRAADAGAAVILVAHRPGAVAGADRTIEVRAAATDAAMPAVAAVASAGATP